MKNQNISIKLKIYHYTCYFSRLFLFLKLLVLLYNQILLSYKFVCLYDFLLTLRNFSLFMQLEVEHSISCNQTVFPTSYFPHNYVRLFNSPYNWKILMQVWFKNEFAVKKSIKDIWDMQKTIWIFWTYFF